jgi:Mn2+/Fe2+ NRAMP family transporter
MKIFKFIKWYWKNSDASRRFATILVPSVITLLISVTIFGPQAFLVFMSVVAALLVVTFIVSIVMFFREQWMKYKREINREQDEVVNRLRGRRQS